MVDHCKLCRKRREALAAGKLVEATNAMHTTDFFQSYLPANVKLRLEEQLAAVSSTKLHVLCHSFETVEGSLLDDCFRMIERTSADDYRKSESKWSPAKKRKEMKLPDMRYILLATKPMDMHYELAGFLSFMVTYEDGQEVVYCYEIHLTVELQGKGIGKMLMVLLEDVGKEVGVKKSMLTVFKSNDRAVNMYESLGYVEDEYSPGPRKLRNGTVKEPTYKILSKALK